MKALKIRSGRIKNVSIEKGEVMAMDNDFNTAGFGSEADSGRRGFGRARVLLREPERCGQCNRVFLGLYPIRACAEHEGLDEI